MGQVEYIKNYPMRIKEGKEMDQYSLFIPPTYGYKSFNEIPKVALPSLNASFRIQTYAKLRDLSDGELFEFLLFHSKQCQQAKFVSYILGILEDFRSKESEQICVSRKEAIRLILKSLFSGKDSSRDYLDIVKDVEKEKLLFAKLIEKNKISKTEEGKKWNGKISELVPLLDLMIELNILRSMNNYGRGYWNYFCTKFINCNSDDSTKSYFETARIEMRRSTRSYKNTITELRFIIGSL